MYYTDVLHWQKKSGSPTQADVDITTIIIIHYY